ncbi:DUF2301 domain-containing membrane protein [Vibrio panuliri]|uniref:Arabinose efflux permease n=1 Tax=Vibrio panuliri TaxID=1381081 RepID=A0ABX3FEX9_9VIBR|nr:DUF2301 domain-containing membrane protein [Vibrio panuliri]KAB1454622.1 hypothetical protein F7O85_17305 [Vibrio panuliri]OLQ90770.1 hypothetical protein BIY20_10505 [Vibrio panuliri]
MANPEYQEKLDSLDKLSVCLYRTGISLFAIALLFLALSLSSLFNLTHTLSLSLLITGIAAAMCAANLHVYNKWVRTIIVWSAWIGILLILSDPQQGRVWLSLGFLFITLSGLALKESFCFKVLGLKVVPILLASSIGLLYFTQTIYASILLALTGLIVGYLSFKKWQMPLHFDIGIKANYEI